MSNRERKNLFYLYNEEGSFVFHFEAMEKCDLIFCREFHVRADILHEIDHIAKATLVADGNAVSQVCFREIRHICNQINQSINRSTNRSTNKSNHSIKSINQPMIQSTSQLTSQLINQSIKLTINPIKRSINQLIGQSIDKVEIYYEAKQFIYDRWLVGCGSYLQYPLRQPKYR